MTFASIPEMLATRGGAHAGRAAIATPTAGWSYRELLDATARIAGALQARGLRRGDRVALLAERGLPFVAGLFGVMAAGGAVCPLEARLPAADLALRLASAGVGWLLADAPHAAKADAIGARRTLSLEQALGSRVGRVVGLQPDDDALMLFTSGSTGVPKAILLTHGNLLANAEGVAERTVVTPEDRLLHAMPLFHTNGINNQLVVPFLRGAFVALLDRFSPAAFFADVARWRPTYLTGVPTMYSRLLAQSAPAGVMAGVRFARCGAAPLSVELHRQIERHLGVPLVASYGLSEATCTSTMNPLDACRIGTVGPALAGQRVAVCRPGTLEPVAAGAEGEVCIAGPVVMKGYVPARDTGDGPGVSQGWLRTGDLGSMDADGYLAITGRLKDIIIRGGENLSPGAIESALASRSEVKACAVVGMPDADLGEVPVAFVVAREGCRLDDHALRDAVEERLSKVCVPVRLFHVDVLPENAIGKVDKKALKVLAAQDA
ncbi:MAG: acyl--CoA ligase [Burkholderiales bacterium]|nr:acyl--CoA ligase [Burkholderiales bacterium]